jgi:hypothetical protein
MRRSALFISMSLACLLAITTLAGCSREKIDWKSAEAADTVESYDHFIERHPDSALVTQARTRVAQLNEDREWKRATATDTAEAYRQFLAQHESGKWSEEARIRVENFALDGAATGVAKPAMDTQAAASPAGVSPVASPKEAQASPATPIAASASEATPARPAAIGGSARPAPTATPAAKHAPAAATPAPAAKAAASAGAPGQFGVQLGAYHSKDAALKNWKQLQVKFGSDLHGLFAHAVPVKQGSDQLFRLQAPVGEESRARGICASLAKQSQPCVVVLPQSQASR